MCIWNEYLWAPHWLAKGIVTYLQLMIHCFGWQRHWKTKLFQDKLQIQETDWDKSITSVFYIKIKIIILNVLYYDLKTQMLKPGLNPWAALWCFGTSQKVLKIMAMDKSVSTQHNKELYTHTEKRKQKWFIMSQKFISIFIWLRHCVKAQTCLCAL